MHCVVQCVNTHGFTTHAFRGSWSIPIHLLLSQGPIQGASQHRAALPLSTTMSVFEPPTTVGSYSRSLACGFLVACAILLLGSAGQTALHATINNVRVSTPTKQSISDAIAWVASPRSSAVDATGTKPTSRRWNVVHIGHSGANHIRTGLPHRMAGFPGSAGPINYWMSASRHLAPETLLISEIFFFLKNHPIWLLRRSVCPSEFPESYFFGVVLKWSMRKGQNSVATLRASIGCSWCCPPGGYGGRSLGRYGGRSLARHWLGEALCEKGGEAQP